MLVYEVGCAGADSTLCQYMQLSPLHRFNLLFVDCPVCIIIVLGLLSPSGAHAPCAHQQTDSAFMDRMTAYGPKFLSAARYGRA